MGELAQVDQIDNREINNKGNILEKLQELFKSLTLISGEEIK